MARPLCRWCGKQIPKRTNWKMLVTDPESMKLSPGHKFLVEKLPQTKAEAQALFNEQVISVKRARSYDYKNDAYSDAGINQVGLWDGESYVDKFFCSKTTCAVSMGYAAAQHHNLTTKAYRDAIAAQNAEA